MKKEIQELYQLNQALLSDKKKCILGTGMHASQTFVDLSVQGVTIDFFVDKSIKDSQASYLGLPLIREEDLKGLDVSVIIASTAWKEIADRLIRQGVTDLYVDLRRYGEVEVQDGYLCSVGKLGMRANTLYILCPAGVGDTLYVAAYAKAVKKVHPDMVRVCLITKENHACIADFFDGVDEVIASDLLARQLDLYSIATKTWYLKNYIYGHFKKNLCQTFDKEYTENNMLPILSYYKKNILKIPEDSALDSFSYRFKNSDGTGRTEKTGSDPFVILMPYANTARMLPLKLWEKLAAFFTEKGYRVYTNGKDDSERPIAGTVALCENIYHMVGICRESKLVISVRNGMCDVLAMSKTPLLILDTDQEFYEKWNTRQFSKTSIHIRCFGRTQEEMEEDLFDYIKYIDAGK